jgi:hypothetical protein
LGELTSLTLLNLGNTKLNGTVPVKITQLVSLTVLNLANNDISGEFPDIIVLDQLAVLDLSSNDQLSDVPGLQALQVEQQWIWGNKCYFQDIIVARKRRRRHDEPSVLQSAMTEDDDIAYIERTSITIPIVWIKLMGKSKILLTEGIFDGKKVAVKRLIVPEDRKTKLKWIAMFRMYLPY